MKTNNRFKTTKPICMIFVSLLLVSAAGPAWGTHLAAYYDARYPTAWTDEPIPTKVRDGLAAAGYETLDADQLKVWMDDRIADQAASVVVFCQDIVPDTVAKTYTANCTLRQYLDAGGKIVVYADIPFWNVGHADNTRTAWWEYGIAGVLDIPGMNWRNDTKSEVTITGAGVEWGLTKTWISRRWTPIENPDEFTVLATDSAGNAAAWVKHFVPGDTSRGFVRILDNLDRNVDDNVSLETANRPSVDDLLRVAEYGLPGYPPARVPNPRDGALHADTWVTPSC